jgi:ssDNA thymidine ADP-ribosyltransferase DarT-like protein
MTPMPDIVILFTSLHKVGEVAVDFVFSDRHAYVQAAQFSNDLQDLERIDWPLLKRQDFKSDPSDPGKRERYMAEALIHSFLPISGLLEIACHGKKQQEKLQEEASRLGVKAPIVVKPDWYFR